MAAFFKNGSFAKDPWETVRSSDTGPRLLSAAEWLEQRSGGAAFPAPLGIRLEPGFAVETLADDIARFDLIVIAFPKFTDGRGYSMAWLLRSRLGYAKELRAVGDVLFDEMQFMLRCGFDAFEIEDPNTLVLLKQGRRPAFDLFYQPGLEREVPEGTRPWARRSGAAR